MPTSLVIVESPAKARTISRFLGDDFVVEASIGAIRDLDPKGLAVDIDDDFKPSYVVPAGKKDVVKRLRSALADVDTLYLATDEDREGEAIAWHLVEVLKPKVPMRRMVFHEITRQAIESAIEESRDIDQGLVDAQEARRVIDRLFGYPVSEVLWRKISTGLSAGRVQSPAVRLVVERERERMAFVPADYWGLEAAFPTSPDVTATLVKLGDDRVATGKDFDSRGRLSRDGAVALDEAGARALVSGLEAGPAPYSVTSVEEKPYRSSPKAPFITSTLQQEGGRKLKMSSSEVMRTAQGLYERGYITYMRTDSVALSDEALAAARSQVTELYGSEFVPDRPRVYKSKTKNAQEAHEAIRPAGDRWRAPDQIRKELSGADLRLYELIWKRTVASQMADATGKTVSVRVGAPVPAAALSGTVLADEVTADNGAVATEWTASGRTITFPGYLRVYVEGSDDPEADLDDRERLLPPLSVGQGLPEPALSADGHTTQPPARYTEASLVKRLEELGIGRPSTYASIMQTIQGRGYVWRKGQALVPSWTAFAVVNLLEGHFSAEIDYSFTARMEDDLDEIAVGRRERVPFLRSFWFGAEHPAGRTDAADGSGRDGNGPAGTDPDAPVDGDQSDDGIVGLVNLIELAKANADPAAVNAIPLGKDDDGNEVVVRNGRYGPYIRRDEETASVPVDLAPDEVTIEQALELLAAPKGDEPIGTDPVSRLPVYSKNGRFGPYVQLGDADTLPEGEKPKMESVFKSMNPAEVTLETALKLLSLPRPVGTDPESGEEITAHNGRYGPYLRKGKDSRSLSEEEELFTVTLEQALALFAQPKRRGRAAPAPPLKELGTDPVSGSEILLKDGRYGPYVTDGEVNASLRTGDTVDELTQDRAIELLQARREYVAKKGGAKKKAPAKKKAAAKKKATTKKAAAKKTTTKKAAAKKKATTKKATTKKAAAKKTTTGGTGGSGQASGKTTDTAEAEGGPAGGEATSEPES